MGKGKAGWPGLVWANAGPGRKADPGCCCWAKAGLALAWAPGAWDKDKQRLDKLTTTGQAKKVKAKVRSRLMKAESCLTMASKADDEARTMTTTTTRLSASKQADKADVDKARQGQGLTTSARRAWPTSWQRTRQRARQARQGRTKAG